MTDMLGQKLNKILDVTAVDISLQPLAQMINSLSAA